jgi:hypothetical protein
MKALVYRGPGLKAIEDRTVGLHVRISRSFTRGTYREFSGRICS